MKLVNFTTFKTSFYRCNLIYSVRLKPKSNDPYSDILLFINQRIKSKLNYNGIMFILINNLIDIVQRDLIVKWWHLS